MLYSRAGSYPPRQPMLYAEDFSPNTPQGACPNCHGLGRVYEVTEKSMVPDDSLTIRERAIAAWPPAWHGQNLRDILVTLGIDVDTPWRELPKKTRDWILFTDEQPTVPVYPGFTPAETRTALRRKTEPAYMGTFTGARKLRAAHVRDDPEPADEEARLALHDRRASARSATASGSSAEALAVTFAGLDIGALAQMPLSQVAEGAGAGGLGPLRAIGGADARRPRKARADAAVTRAAARDDTARRVAAGGSAHAGAPDVRRTPNLSEEKRIVAQRIAADLVARIATLESLGLGYLSLDRSTPTLSPGELQRLRLATQIRSNLFGVVYVLDEPTAGLHPKDGAALLAALDELKRVGQLDLRRRARPGDDAARRLDRRRRSRCRRERRPRPLQRAARRAARRCAASHTARYLFAPPEPERSAPREPQRLARTARHHPQQPAHARRALSARRADRGDRRLGLGQVEPGQPGAGRARLPPPRPRAGERRRRAGERRAERRRGDARPHRRAAWSAIQRLVRVDQKPIGRTPRSNLATYTGLFDGVRKLFAATPAARSRRYDAGRFSFNVAKGRCETCEGEGFVSVELLFMPSVYAPCPTCHGARYNDEDARDHLARQEHRRRAAHDASTTPARSSPTSRRCSSRSRCCATSASATFASASPRPSSRAARRSASSSRPSCRSSSAAARSTSSTSRRPGCIRPTSTS